MCIHAEISYFWPLVNAASVPLLFMFYLKTYNFSHVISKITHNSRRDLDLFQLIPEQNPSQSEVRFATLIIQDRNRVGIHGQPSSG